MPCSVARHLLGDQATNEGALVVDLVARLERAVGGKLDMIQRGGRGFGIFG